MAAGLPPTKAGFMVHTAAKSAAARFRSSVFKTFPVALRGNAGRKTICLGTLKSAIRSRMNCSKVFSSSVWPSAAATNATGCSPLRASGTPMTAAARADLAGLARAEHFPGIILHAHLHVGNRDADGTGLAHAVQRIFGNDRA